MLIRKHFLLTKMVWQYFEHIVVNICNNVYTMSSLSLPLLPLEVVAKTLVVSLFDSVIHLIFILYL